VVAPARHRRTEDAEGGLSSAQVGRYGQAVRTCSNDCDVSGLKSHGSTPGMVRVYRRIRARCSWIKRHIDAGPRW
jgi:hypothetical protein